MHARRSLLLAPLLACAVAVPALAQSQPALTNYPACNGKPLPQDSEAAHSAFLLGQRFFNEADYGSALHNFVDAYKIDCTKTELLLTIARANELGGNKAEAVHALETYLARAPNVDPEAKSQIQKRIDNLKALIASQTPAPTAPPVPVPPPKETAPPPPPPTATALPPPPPAQEGGHTAAPWIVTGIGGAGAVAGLVILLVGNGNYQAAEKACHGSPTGCAAGSPEIGDGNSALSLEHVGVGVLIGGGAVAVGGVIWHFVEPTGQSSPAKGASIEPALGPGYAGVAGRF
jgi:hypothetical protein